MTILRGALIILLLALALALLIVAAAGPLWLPPIIEPTFLKDTPELRIAVRKSVLDWLQTCFAALTAAGLIGTLFYTARNYKVAAENLRVTEYSKLSEAFGKAMEALGSPTVSARVGGIHALGRLALGSREDHARIVGLLCDDLRRAYPHTLDADGQPATPAPEPAADMQAALDVIAKRNTKWDSQPIDLSGCCLAAGDLRRALLRSANLSGADLRGAWLWKADLQNADLSGSLLESANGQAARMKGAILCGAKLDKANFSDADLRKVDLARADGTIVAARARLGWCWKRRYPREYPKIRLER